MIWLRGWNFFHTFSRVHLTSAEVNGLPSCHFTPLRRWKVSVLLSLETSQLSASAGRSLKSLSYSTRPSNTLALKKPVGAAVLSAEVRITGSGWMIAVSVPPRVWAGTLAENASVMAVAASSFHTVLFMFCFPSIFCYALLLRNLGQVGVERFQPRIFQRALRLIAVLCNALEARRMHGKEVQLDERQGRQFSLGDLLEFLEQRDALGLRGSALGLLNQTVDFRIVVAGAIGPRDVFADPAGPVHAREADLRIGEGSVPGNRRVEVAVAVDPFGEGGGVLAADIDFDADALQGLFEVFGGAAIVVAIRQIVIVDAEAHTVGATRKAGFIEQRFGLFGVVRIARHGIVEELRQRGRHNADRRLAVAVPDHFVQTFEIGGMGDGAAYAHIFQVFVAEVVVEIEHRRRPLIPIGFDLDLAGLGQALRFLGRHRADYGVLRVAVFQRGGAGAGVRHDLEDDLVQVRLALVPIVGIALQRDVVAAAPLLEHERPRANGLVVVRIVEHVGAL